MMHYYSRRQFGSNNNWHGPGECQVYFKGKRAIMILNDNRVENVQLEPNDNVKQIIDYMSYIG